MAIHPEMKAHFFGKFGKQHNRCLSAEMTCQRPAIRAHSVQNSGALDLICRNGHVICPTIRFRGDRPPEIDFTLVGRNKATTFAGLCSKHDREIFREIDTNPIDVTNPLHLYLLANRSIIRELHVTMEGARRIQSAYEKLVELDLAPKGVPSPPGMEAISHFLKAWRIYRYRCNLDETKGNPERLKSHTRVLTTDMPRLAASVFFGVGDNTNDIDIVGAFINVIPISQDQTAVAISYLDEHSDICGQFFSDLFQANDHDFKIQLSSIIIRYAENFAINPDYFDSWPEDMKYRIRELFVRTILDEKEVEEDDFLII